MTQKSATGIDISKKTSTDKVPRPFMLVTGAAGFIGSHLVDRLLADGYGVIGVDNLVRGTRANLAWALAHPRFSLLEADLDDESKSRRVLGAVMEHTRIDTIWHLAANSDIQAGVANPHVDLRDTLMSTFTTLLLMREFGIDSLAFASTSAVYGDLRTERLKEESGPLFPISNYGAMKLASEGLISAAVESHLQHAWIFRFPNVVGSRSTHGVIFDLLTKLRHNSEELEVLGDGNQCKPYLHVSELIEAMIFICQNACNKLNCFNIGPEDRGTTVRHIAEEVLRASGATARIRFTGGDRGWVGDVPRFSYSTEKLHRLGWRPRLGSVEAIREATGEVARELGF